MTFGLGGGRYLGIGAAEIVILGLTVVLAACCVAAYFTAISSMVKAARAKSERFSAGKLWFIGLFTTPITLGILCCAIKDESLAAPAQAAPAQPAVEQPAATAAPAAQPASAARPTSAPAEQPAPAAAAEPQA